MSRRTIVISGALTAIAVGAVALAIAAQKKTAPSSAVPTTERAAALPSGALPVMWQVPPFSFPDQHGRTTTTANLRGHVWIAHFVFTRCTTICPLITAKMAMLQRRLEARKSLRFVSFSVDPVNDTPEALKRYAAEWRPAESRWVLLRTETTGLEKLTAAMYVSVKPVENDIAHSNLFFLVDATSGVRGIYESDKNDAIERLVRDTEALLETSPSPPSPAVATGKELYEALACGACHARKELAPPIEGLLGRRVELVGGGVVVADAPYIRESIALPEAKLVHGYSLRMPSYGRDLTPSELDALVEHTTMLASATPASGPPKSAEKPLIFVDPVCSMDVRVVETTPRASHAGQTTYFCSEMCRERFVADPGRYVQARAR
jgi:protein SCO1